MKKHLLCCYEKWILFSFLSSFDMRLIIFVTGVMMTCNNPRGRLEAYPTRPCPEALPWESKPAANSSAKWDSAYGPNPHTNLSPLEGPSFPEVWENRDAFQDVLKVSELFRQENSKFQWSRTLPPLCFPSLWAPYHSFFVCLFLTLVTKGWEYLKIGSRGFFWFLW